MKPCRLFYVSFPVRLHLPVLYKTGIWHLHQLRSDPDTRNPGEHSQTHFYGATMVNEYAGKVFTDGFVQ